MLSSKLVINFVDFKKAFDGIHWTSVWNILKCYGIPERIIVIIQNFNKESRCAVKESRCAVRAGGHVGDWFDVVASWPLRNFTDTRCGRLLRASTHSLCSSSEIWPEPLGCNSVELIYCRRLNNMMWSNVADMSIIAKIAASRNSASPECRHTWRVYYSKYDVTTSHLSVTVWISATPLDRDGASTVLVRFLRCFTRSTSNTARSLGSLGSQRSALDCVDHDILVRRLQRSYGIEGTALAWIISFLTGHTQQVCYNGILSAISHLIFGVPQGWSCGPLLYLLYAVEVFDVIADCGLVGHSYADAPVSMQRWAVRHAGTSRGLGGDRDFGKGTQKLHGVIYPPPPPRSGVPARSLHWTHRTVDRQKPA